MNHFLAFALIVFAAQGGAPEGQGLSEGFLEYLGTFEPDDEATIVDIALDAEEAGGEPPPAEDEEETGDDAA